VALFAQKASIGSALILAFLKTGLLRSGHGMSADNLDKMGRLIDVE
jgi:hypothetical protein